MLKEIGQVASFVICVGMLLHFRANESYEKYIRLCISLILLLFLTQPFFGIIHGVKGGDIMQMIQGFDSQMEEALLDMQPDEKDMEMILRSMGERAVAEAEKEQDAEYGELTNDALLERETDIQNVENICIDNIEIREE